MGELEEEEEGEEGEEEEGGGFSSVLSDHVKPTVWLQSEPLGAVVCGLLAVGMASWWWAWPLGCGFLLPSTSGGNSVYYLRASVLFSHGSQRARGLSIAAAILIPAFTNLWEKKSKPVKCMLVEVFLATSRWGWCDFDGQLC